MTRNIQTSNVDSPKAPSKISKTQDLVKRTPVVPELLELIAPEDREKRSVSAMAQITSNKQVQEVDESE